MGHSTKIWGYGADIERQGHDDVVLRIVGRFLEDPLPGFPNILWVISHPEMLLPNLIRGYQKVFVASEWFCERSAQTWNADWTYLPQATDPGIFPYGHQSDTSGRISFVANTQYRDRDYFRITESAQLPISYVGRGWEKHVSTDAIETDQIPNELLSEHYNRHGFVICDQFTSMKSCGFMSNRILDVLSCGAHPVIKRPIDFPEELTPFVTFASNTSELQNAWENWKARDIALTARNAQQAADIVRQKYAFDVVVQPIVAAAEQALLEGNIAAQMTLPEVTPARTTSGEETSRHFIVSDSDEIYDLNKKNAEFLAVDAQSTAPDGDYSLTVLLAGRLTGMPNIPEEHALHIVAQRLSNLIRLIPVIELSNVATIVQDTDTTALSEYFPDGTHLMPITHLTALYDQVRNDILQGVPRQNVSKALYRLLQYTRRVKALDAPYSSFQNDFEFQVAKFNIPFALHDLAAMPGLHGNPIEEETTKSHYSLPGRKAPARFKRPVGVFIHAFYVDELEDLIGATERIQSKFYYISTNEESKCDEIRCLLDRLGIENYEIRVTDNVGRDIFPKFVAFRDVYENHDIVLHLHTKKSAHSKKSDGWMDHILADLLDNTEAVNRIVSLFASIPELGIIAPRPPSHLTGGYRWTVNKHIASAIFPDLDLPDDGEFVFPMGSMFWARTDALRPILDRQLTAEDFPKEAGQLDGTTAHALERLIGVCASDAGYHVIKYTATHDNKYRKFRTRLKTNKDLFEELLAANA
ncbi:rhamnan synthesis F family protein [Halocynthiibacter styelae]|uniref:Rhamnan synthesis protein F n=1 Tax=Halocynthiibacter styelae TaxID=2761955 RepID=A0A8J7IEQ3_9RHOB|nr:rhamnan synthesis F family protein [Paenihalocynthiibacter styelae]MBI1495074.1 hypothetical protein [Paenihalocynthiibacter styelae]